MSVQPLLETERLRLRPFAACDAADVQRLAGGVRIANTTLAIPHPYPDGAAERWIAWQPQAFDDNAEIVYAATEKSGGELLGAVSLMGVSALHARAEIGHWIAAGHWGRGYGTEAARAAIAYATSRGDISRIVGRCMARNPASARVLEKCGLQREGVLVQHVSKDGRFEDMLAYGLVLPGRATTRRHASTD